jgi:flagellar assembly factor FliW
MQIHTVNFGNIEVPEDRIIYFKEGLPGFPNVHRFAVIELEEWKPFHYLQGLDDLLIALLVIDPFTVCPEYQFQLTPADGEDIKCSSTDNVAVYAVATIPEKPEDATLNLMAPIVINEKSRSGKQVILHESGYSVRHPLFKTSGPNQIN